MSPRANFHFSVETGLHFTQKETSGWKRGWIQSSEPCPTVCDRGQLGPRVAGGRGWCEFHPASAGGMIRQCSQLPQLEMVFPIWILLPFWNAALSWLFLATGGTDPPWMNDEHVLAPAVEMWATATSVSGLPAKELWELLAKWIKGQETG